MLLLLFTLFPWAGSQAIVFIVMACVGMSVRGKEGPRWILAALPMILFFLGSLMAGVNYQLDKSLNYLGDGPLGRSIGNYLDNNNRRGRPAHCGHYHSLGRVSLTLV